MKKRLLGLTLACSMAVMRRKLRGGCHNGGSRGGGDHNGCCGWRGDHGGSGAGGRGGYGVKVGCVGYLFHGLLSASHRRV